MRHVLLVGLLVSATCAAQQWGLGVSASAPGSVWASDGGSQSATTAIPVGPMQPLYVANYTSAPDCAMWVTPSVSSAMASLAVVVKYQCWTTVPAPFLPGGTATCTMDLLVSAPQTTFGSLSFSLTQTASGIASSQTNTTIDLDADGVVEWQGWTGQSLNHVMPMSIPAGGRVVRVHMFCMGSIHAGEAQANLTWTFTPGSFGVGPFDTTGSSTSLSAETPGPDLCRLQLDTPGHVPLLLAFGLQPVVQPLWPGVTLLVTPDTILSIGDVTFELPPLPPGFAIFAQGLSADGAGVLHGSNSVRALWY